MKKKAEGEMAEEVDLGRMEEEEKEEGEEEKEEGEEEMGDMMDMEADCEEKEREEKKGEAVGADDQEVDLVARFSLPRTLHFHHFISYMPVILEVGPVPTILHTFLQVEVAEEIARLPARFQVTSSFIKESEWPTYFDFCSFRYRYRKLRDRKMLRDGHNTFMRRHGDKVNAIKAIDANLHSPDNPFVMVKLECISGGEGRTDPNAFNLPRSMGILVLWIEFRHTWQTLEPGTTHCPVVSLTLIPRSKWEKRLPHQFLLNVEKYTTNPDVHAKLKGQQKDVTYIKTNLRHAIDYAGIFAPCDRKSKEE
jgi:hypothetical protein